MKDIIAIKYNLNTQRDYLKLKLEQKELVEYTNWRAKDENVNSREAMDKVVARLKLESDTWLNEEADLIDILYISIEEGLSVEEAISDFPLEGFDETIREDLELSLDGYDSWKDEQLIGY